MPAGDLPRRVEELGVERREDMLILSATSGEGLSAPDLSLERLSLAEKGDIFEDVFGLKPVLS